MSIALRGAAKRAANLASGKRAGIALRLLFPVALLAPSLAGYMRREKKRVAIRSTPYPCYASSPDDISETIVPGMFLKAKQFEVTEENSYMSQFTSGERYMVKGLTEEGAVDVYTHKVAGRTLLAEDSPYWTFPKEQIQTWFEDSDKFVITENVRDRFPELISNLDAQLDTLVIGEEGRLFDHSRQDVGCEVLKGNFLCSKEMRMGKTAEALAACELIGSKRRASVRLSGGLCNENRCLLQGAVWIAHMPFTQLRSIRPIMRRNIFEDYGYRPIQ